MSPRRLLAAGALILSLVLGVFILLLKKMEREGKNKAWVMFFAVCILIVILSAKLLLMALR